MTDEGVRLKTAKLLVCEGKEEKALVAQMIAEGLVQQLDVLALGDADPAGGIQSLKRNLEGLPALTGFHNITSMGFFLDNDSDPRASFDYVRSVLDVINGDNNSDLFMRLSVPAAPYVTQRGGPISITTFFSPGPGRDGCLETLLLEVLRDLKGPKIACVDDLVRCSGILAEVPAWAGQKVDKAKVRAALAIIYRSNPAVSVAMAWRNDATIIPASHPRLAPIRDFINII